MTARAGGGPPPILVRWRLLEVSSAERIQVARDIAQTLLAERQRRVDAPQLLGVRAAAAPTRQSSAPLRYELGDEKIVGVEFADASGRTLRLLTDSGRTVEMKMHARRPAPATVVDVENPKVKSRRRAARVMVRPGSRRRSDRADPTLGLEELVGPVVWQPGSKGAWVAIVERDPDGNAIGCGRLSGEDQAETMATQVEGLLALETRFDELRYRYLVLAVDMSGTRPVRHDPNVPFAPGTEERDDMVVVDRLIQQGWVEQIAWWSDDRIARKVLPAQMLFERWQQNDIGLWLVVRGGRIEYEDDLLLNVMAVMSSNERDRTVRRLRSGALRKGPLAGKGHLNRTPHGFVRDPKTNDLVEDAKAWDGVLRIFELADIGPDGSGVGLSAQKIAEQMATEGYEIDHDAVRKIIENPLYATGEWTVNIGAIEVPQRPVSLSNPVPIDRFQRVQDWIALRRGGNENTPLGEVLYNYTDTRHKQCQEQRGGVQDRPIRLRGYNLRHHKRESPQLRHYPTTPPSCKGHGRGKAGAWDWQRDVLQPPMVEELRKLATHPEILRELAEAERHNIASTTVRLTENERQELQQQKEALEQHRQAAADQWVESVGPDTEPDFADFQRLDESYTKRIRTIERRLDNDSAMAVIDQSTIPAGDYADRLAAFLEIMTVDTPTDPRMKALRARLFSLIVSKIVIDDDGKGPITITIESALVPPGAPVDRGNPIFAAGEFLDRYMRDKNGIKGREERIVEQTLNVKTDFESSHSKSVSTIALDLEHIPTVREWRVLGSKSLSNTSWHRGRRGEAGVPAWRVTLAIETGALIAGADLTSAARLVLAMLPVDAVASRAQLEAAAKEAGINRNALGAALLTLEKRGWLVSAPAGGPNGVVRVWCRRDSSVSAVQGSTSSATRLPRVPPRTRPLDETTSPLTLSRRRQHANRQVQRIERIRNNSLCVHDVCRLTSLCPDQLVAAVRATELSVIVMADGEVRFPSWQFDATGASRRELTMILRAATQQRLSPWALHVLMTRPNRTDRATLAGQLAGVESCDAEGLLEVIVAAITELAKQPAGHRLQR